MFVLLFVLLWCYCYCHRFTTVHFFLTCKQSALLRGLFSQKCRLQPGNTKTMIYLHNRYNVRTHTKSSTFLYIPKHIEAEIKWSPTLQTTFLEWKLLYSDYNFTESFCYGPVDNNPALVQIMAWCRTGDEPLSEQMMASLGDAHMSLSALMS